MERLTQGVQAQGRVSAWQQVHGCHLQLSEARVEADAKLCTAVVHGLGRWREATEVQELLAAGNVVTANAWLKSCKAWRVALLFMANMAFRRLQADAVSYNTAP